MKVKKVKVTKTKDVEVTYEIDKGAGKIDDITLHSSEQASQEFYSCMSDLAPHVIEICEFGKLLIDKIGVRGISVSYNGSDDHRSFVITAFKKLDNSNVALLINTPNKFESIEGKKKDAKNLLTNDCVAALNKVLEATEEYIGGKRQQTDLFDQGQGGTTDSGNGNGQNDTPQDSTPQDSVEGDGTGQALPEAQQQEQEAPVNAD